MKERKEQKVTVFGKIFKNLREVADYFGVDYCTLRGRLHRGLTAEEAVRFIKKIKKVWTDPYGVVYPTLMDMLADYDINIKTFYSRQAMGWPLDKILNEPVHPRGPYTVNGTQYRTAAEIELNLKISRNDFMLIVGKGYTPQEAADLLLLEKKRGLNATAM